MSRLHHLAAPQGDDNHSILVKLVQPAAAAALALCGPVEAVQCGIHGIRQHAMVAQPSLAFENWNALNFQW
jgi:hypothetical protein